MNVSISLPWSDGEAAMHKLLPTSWDYNPTAALMTTQAAFMLQRAPLIALGTLDAQGRPWATVWGGKPGLSQPLGGNSIAGFKSPVDRRFDPVVEALTDGKNEGQVVREEGVGRMVAGLPLDLVTRNRVKVYGRMIAGSARDDEVGTMQLVVKIEQSLGNCPKYMNRKTITPAGAHPELLSTSANLSPEARALIAKADSFFISSNGTHDMDCNYRGGPAGFVRILPSDDSPTATTTLIYPEYSGNRLYQTLGNLHTNPLAGLCFPDFETGDVLYLTGRTSILHGPAAAAALPRTNLAIKLEVTAARFVRQGLTFRGAPVEDGAEGMSPYNPPVLRLAAEGSLLAGTDSSPNTGLRATLIERELLTPDIARFRFALGRPAQIEPGRWVALDLSSELDYGYSHMRDDDPKSLNDDFVRTFTVTATTAAATPPTPSPSPSPPAPSESQLSTHFDITIRRVGRVTSFLFAQNLRHLPLTLKIRGFSGEFRMAPLKPSSSATSSAPTTTIPFIAAGIGITPLLAESHLLRPPTASVRLLWTVRLSSPADLALVRHVLLGGASDVAAEVEDAGKLKKLGGAPVHPSVARDATLFLTGPAAAELDEGAVEELRATGATVKLRRLGREDVADLLVGEGQDKVYLCAGNALRDAVVGWLPGREVVFEDFSF
ncbi:hypothetical protein C8Q80DRAFT_1220298 [Daedaleopsis nitida]|nr:hypothetical protein C8Q80DRAFT_1220298 [Daedaleopsis nitida]